jgi:hypothetical protein
VGNPEGKRPPEIPRRMWEDTIRKDLRDRMGVVWTGLIWVRIWTSGGLL